LTIWYLYIIRCRDASLYTGVTTDVGRRFAEHGSGGPLCAKYLRGKGLLTLVFSKKAGSRSRALQMEYRVKHLSKPEKERIVLRQELSGHPRKKRKRVSRASP
jgi:putative endonuclease